MLHRKDLAEHTWKTGQERKMELLFLTVNNSSEPSIEARDIAAADTVKEAKLSSGPGSEQINEVERQVLNLPI